MQNKREAHEQPESVAAWGWKYHHLGIPTENKIPGERYLPRLKIYVTGFETSPFGIEWMRFEKDCPVPDLIKRVPHLAFEVDDLDREIQDHHLEVISPPGAPSKGVRAAMIRYQDAPVELIEFRKNR